MSDIRERDIITDTVIIMRDIRRRDIIYRTQNIE